MGQHPRHLRHLIAVLAVGGLIVAAALLAGHINTRNDAGGIVTADLNVDSRGDCGLFCAFTAHRGRWISNQQSQMAPQGETSARDQGVERTRP